jgi:hypothetical protein
LNVNVDIKAGYVIRLIDPDAPAGDTRQMKVVSPADGQR